MSHWALLEQKLGKDVVDYVIAPFLLPPKQDRAILKACLWDLKILFEIMRIKFHRALKINQAIQCLHSNTREDKLITEEARSIINRKIHGLFDRTYSKLGVKGIFRWEIESRWISANYPALTVEWVAGIVTQRKVCYTYKDLRPSRIQHERDFDSDNKVSYCIHCLIRQAKWFRQPSEINIYQKHLGIVMREIRQRLSRKI